MKAYNQEIHSKELLQFFTKHPAMMASMAYALLTLCGLIYSYSFYAKFDIPILKLADLSDMLIAGISEPAAILMFCGGIVLAVLADFMFGVTYRGQQRWEAKPKSVKRRLFLLMYYTPKRKIEVIGFLLFIFILYAFLFVELYAEWKSEKIKQGKGIAVVLTTENESNMHRYLLGSTTNFVITYDPKTSQSMLTPVEGIQKILPRQESKEKPDPEEQADKPT